MISVKSLWMACFCTVVASSCCGWGQRYHHTKLASFRQYLSMGLSDSGDYFYSATNEDPNVNPNPDAHLYVNGADYSGQVLGSQWQEVIPATVLSDRTVIWGAYTYAQGSGQQRYDVYVNGTNYTLSRFGADHQANYWVVNSNGLVAAQVTNVPRHNGLYDTWVGQRNIAQEVLGDGSYRQSGPSRLLDDGRLLWTGQGATTGYQWDAFMDTQNLSAALLGAHRRVAVDSNEGVLANELGDYAIDGYGDLTAGHTNVFHNGVNLGQCVFGTLNHTAWLKGVTDDSQVVWLGHDERDPYSPWDVYRGTTDISSFLGPNRRVNNGVVRFSVSGHVAWLGADSLGATQEMWLDQTDYSNLILGTTYYAMPTGFAADGELLWEGRGTSTGNFHDAFVGDFDISADAPLGSARGGDGACGAGAPTVDARGDVLWTWTHANGNQTDLWLSTPVSEPTGALIWLPVLVAVVRRRRLPRT